MKSIKLILFYSLFVFSGMVFALNIELTETTPIAQTLLNKDEPVYIHVQYNSDTPLRFQARGLAKGNEITINVRYNPSPIYPAGKGEAIAWVAYNGAAKIDTIRVNVYDEKWQKVAEKELHLSFEWLENSTQQNTRSTPEWALRLNKTQQENMRHSNSSASIAEVIFFQMLFLTIPGYWILQIYTFRKYTAGWKKIACLPLLVTIPLCLYTLFALFAGSNLWPVLMIFVTPFAFIYLAGVMLAKKCLG